MSNEETPTMPTDEVPSTLDAVDVSWLNAQLATSGFEATASSISARPLDGFLGAMGEVGIFDVTWAGSSDLPTSFIAKCPKDDDLAQLMNSVMQSYKREYGFYNELAGDVPMRVPTSYVNAYDAETDRAILMIEKIDGRPGDIQTGCSVEEMEHLLRLLARLHGAFWMSDKIADKDWMFDWASPLWQMGIPMCHEHWYSLNEAWPDMTPPDIFAALDKHYMSDIDAALARMHARPWTFVHNDYQLDNVIFADDGPVIIDWQTVMRSFPGIDVGWLLATGESPATLAEETALLDAYRDELARCGGPSWSHDELVDDMVIGMTYYITGNSIPVDQQRHTLPQGDRGRDRLEQFLFNCIAAADRWNLVDRLG